MGVALVLMKSHRTMMLSCPWLLLSAAALYIYIGVGICHAMLLQPRVLNHHGQKLIKTHIINPRQAIALHSTAPTVEQDEIITSTYSTSNASTNEQQLFRLRRELGDAFAQKLLQLEDYQRNNGHCLVPKRYEDNPSLGNWVNKQRQNYKKFLKGEKSSMNEKRISALNKIGFVWNATSTPLRSTQHNNNAWQKMYNQLSQFHAENGHCGVPSSSSLGQWVVRQRFLYRQDATSRAKSSLTEERIKLLNQINFPWMTRSEQLWELRMSELHEFKKQNGHVMIPRKYPENPQLSAWVATQRKNYNRKQAGKPSPLSVRRIQELEDVGFVWSYWDYNFMANEKLG